MLDKMRANSRSWITWLIFGAIIVVFVVAFGPGANGCAGAGPGGGVADAGGYAAKVNGREISTADFNQAYGNFFRQYQQQMGANFTPEMAEQLRLKDTVLDRLVERELLIDAAKAQGLAVGDEEVAKAIQQIPAFQKDGAFDFETYRSVVQNAIGVTPDRFEADLREDLLREKVLAQLRQAAKATDDEVKAEFVRDNNRANLSFVRFPTSQFTAAAQPTDAQVQALLATDEGKKRVEEEFQRQAFRFKKPKQVSAQHILVKLPEDATEAQVAEAKTKLEEAKKKIEGGADFAAVAKELSEDAGTKEKGGDLGFFGPGQMVKPFEEAAFALEPGKMSEPVRSRFGLHLIKVNEVREPTEQKLEEVQAQLARELLAADGAKVAAKAAAEKALADAKAGNKTLAAMFPKPEAQTDEHGHAVGGGEAPAGPAADETGPFSLGSDYVPRLGISGDLVRASAATDAAGQLLPGVYEVSGSYVIAQVVDRTQPDLASFEEKKDTYRDRVLQKKEDALEQGFLKKLREDAKVETNPALFAADVGAEG